MALKLNSACYAYQYVRKNDVKNFVSTRYVKINAKFATHIRSYLDLNVKIDTELKSVPTLKITKA